MDSGKCVIVYLCTFIYFALVTLLFVDMLGKINKLQDMLATMGGITTMLGYAFSMYVGWVLLMKTIRSH